VLPTDSVAFLPQYRNWKGNKEKQGAGGGAGGDVCIDSAPACFSSGNAASTTTTLLHTNSTMCMRAQCTTPDCCCNAPAGPSPAPPLGGPPSAALCQLSYRRHALAAADTVITPPPLPTPGLQCPPARMLQAAAGSHMWHPDAKPAAYHHGHFAAAAMHCLPGMTLPSCCSCLCGSGGCIQLQLLLPAAACLPSALLLEAAACLSTHLTGVCALGSHGQHLLQLVPHGITEHHLHIIDDTHEDPRMSDQQPLLQTPPTGSAER
jgi:hypothetical protein